MAAKIGVEQVQPNRKRWSAGEVHMSPSSILTEVHSPKTLCSEISEQMGMRLVLEHVGFWFSETERYKIRNSRTVAFQNTQELLCIFNSREER